MIGSVSNNIWTDLNEIKALLPIGEVKAFHDNGDGSLKIGDYAISQDIVDNDGLTKSGSFHIQSKNDIAGNICLHAGEEPPVSGHGDGHRLWVDLNHNLKWQNKDGDSINIVPTNIDNWDSAYGWGDHAGLYDPIGTAFGLIGSHESTYNHSSYNAAYTHISDDGSDHGFISQDVTNTGNPTFATQKIFGSVSSLLRLERSGSADVQINFLNAGGDTWTIGHDNSRDDFIIAASDDDFATNAHVRIDRTSGRFSLRSSQIVIDNSTYPFVTSKYNSQGVAWSSSKPKRTPSLIFQAIAQDRPEISWYRGSRTYPEFSIRQHTTNDKGVEFYSGGGTSAPTMTMAFNLGNVGIGTITPGLPLEVRNTDDNLAIFFDSRAQAQGVGGGIAFGGKYTDAGGEAMAGRIGTQKTNGTSGHVGFDMVFQTQDSVGSITDRLLLTSDGKCGIGNITPTKTLDVNGDTRVRGNLTTDDNIIVNANYVFEGGPSKSILRKIQITVRDGATPGTNIDINKTTTQGRAYNAPSIVDANDLAKSGSSGSYSLSSNGQNLTLTVSKTVTHVLSSTVISDDLSGGSGGGYYVHTLVLDGNIQLMIEKSGEDNNEDWTSITNAGSNAVIFDIVFITSN